MSRNTLTNSVLLSIEFRKWWGKTRNVKIEFDKQSVINSLSLNQWKQFKRLVSLDSKILNPTWIVITNTSCAGTVQALHVLNDLLHQGWCCYSHFTDKAERDSEMIGMWWNWNLNPGNVSPGPYTQVINYTHCPVGSYALEFTHLVYILKFVLKRPFLLKTATITT